MEASLSLSKKRTNPYDLPTIHKSAAIHKSAGNARLTEARAEAKIVYDGPSLPMLTVGNSIYRVQVLDRNEWKTLETEQAYAEFVAHLQGEPI